MFLKVCLTSIVVHRLYLRRKFYLFKVFILNFSPLNNASIYSVHLLSSLLQISSLLLCTPSTAHVWPHSHNPRFCYVQKRRSEQSWEAHRGESPKTLLPPSLHLLSLQSNFKYKIVCIAFLDYVWLQGSSWVLSYHCGLPQHIRDSQLTDLSLY